MEKRWRRKKAKKTPYGNATGSDDATTIMSYKDVRQSTVPRGASNPPTAIEYCYYREPRFGRSAAVNRRRRRRRTSRSGARPTGGSLFIIGEGGLHPYARRTRHRLNTTRRRAEPLNRLRARVNFTTADAITAERGARVPVTPFPRPTAGGSSPRPPYVYASDGGRRLLQPRNNNDYFRRHAKPKPQTPVFSRRIIIIIIIVIRVFIVFSRVFRRRRSRASGRFSRRTRPFFGAGLGKVYRNPVTLLVNTVYTIYYHYRYCTVPVVCKKKNIFIFHFSGVFCPVICSDGIFIIRGSTNLSSVRPGKRGRDPGSKFDNSFGKEFYGIKISRNIEIYEYVSRNHKKKKNEKKNFRFFRETLAGISRPVDWTGSRSNFVDLIFWRIGTNFRFYIRLRFAVRIRGGVHKKKKNYIWILQYPAALIIKIYYSIEIRFLRPRVLK